MDFREVTENEDILESDMLNEIVEDEAKDMHSQEDSTEDDYEDICYVCRRPESIAGKMISIYGGVKVCVDCMQRTMDTMNSSGFGMPPGMGFEMPVGKNTGDDTDGQNQKKTPHIQMINLSDFNNMFGVFP